MSYSLPKNSLIDLLSQPTVVAVLASVGIHGLVGISWDRLPFSGKNEPNPWTTVDLVNLSPEEISRLPDFSSPQATGSGSLNSSSEPLAALPELGPLPPSPGKLGLEPLTLPPGNPLYDLPLDLPPAPSLRDLKTPLPSLQDYQSPSEFRERLTNPQPSGSSNSMAIEQLLALERLERAQIEREIEQRERQQRLIAEQNRQIPPPPPQEFRLQDVPPPPQGSFPASENQQRPFSGMNEETDASEFADLPIPENVPGPGAIARSDNANPSPPPEFNNPSGNLPNGVNPGMGPAASGGAVDLQTQPRNSEQDGIEEGAQAVVPPNVPTPSDRPQEGATVPDKIGTDPDSVRELWAKITEENNRENPTGLVSDRQNAMLEGLEAYAKWVENLESQYGEVRTNKAIAVANQYPLEACPQKLEGRALFGVLVNPDGQIIDGPRRLLGSGQDILDSFARKFVQDMRFAPVSEPTVHQYAFEFQYAPQLCTNAPSPGTTPTPPVQTPQPELNNPQPSGENATPVLDAPPSGDNSTPVLDAPPSGENSTPVLDAPPSGENPTPQLDVRPTEGNPTLRIEQPPASRPQQLRNPSPEGEPSKPVNGAPQVKPAPGPVPGPTPEEPTAPVEAVEPEPVQEESVPEQVQPQEEPIQPVETPEMEEEEGLTPDGLESTPTEDSQELPTPEASETEGGEPVEGDNLESEPESEPVEDAAEMEGESEEAIADEEERDPEI
ncbi:energy transducer TonB [Laspinema sp. D1]|uniref:energy transducer TonB n=1 Tax=Laspinema palackyanum TaxID=3231601 RepID=UPI003499BD64|nr:energy transducer TonB [Laspinema sp. D2b]